MEPAEARPAARAGRQLPGLADLPRGRQPPGRHLRGSGADRPARPPLDRRRWLVAPLSVADMRAQPSASSRRPGGASQRQVTPQAAPSPGPPRPAPANQPLGLRWHRGHARLASNAQAALRLPRLARCRLLCPRRAPPPAPPPLRVDGARRARGGHVRARLVGMAGAGLARPRPSRAARRARSPAPPSRAAHGRGARQP